MKNQLEKLFITLLKLFIVFLFGLVTIEGVIIILDLLGNEIQAEKIASYIQL
jgi:hypothetical protein